MNRSSSRRRWSFLLLAACVPTMGARGDEADSSPPAMPSVTPAALSVTAARVDLRIDAKAEHRAWKFIVLHHSATSGGNISSIDREHRRRVDASGNFWKGIGYHFVIGNGDGMPDGQVQATFRWREQRAGAHAGVRDYNELGIGICLIGNFEQSPPTPAQIAALDDLLFKLRGEFRIAADQILRHGDLKATACPGKLLAVPR